MPWFPAEWLLVASPIPVRVLLLTLLAAVLGCSSHAQDGTTSLRAVRYGEQVFIRSPFSAADDLVIRIGKGANGQVNFAGTYLVQTSAGMGDAELSGGRLIHGCGDDATPWNLNGTYIGANHGCSDAREVLSVGHGRTTADLGTVWKDGAGAEFVLLKIQDADKLWFLSVNLSDTAVWRFTKTVTGPALTRADGQTIPFTDAHMVQLRPACRITRQDYLIDGQTPLGDGEPVTCEFLDIVEDYDIVNPGSLVRDMMDHPGEQRSFVADQLEATVSNSITYRFHPNGACVIDYRAMARQEFNLGYMGFIQSAKLTAGTNYTTHEYFIPKTVPFTQDSIAYDFHSGQDYRTAPPSALYFSVDKQNVEDPGALPERFIQLLGHEEDGRVVNDVGYALGYSLVTGITAPETRAANCGRALFLYTSAKSYPAAIDAKMGNPIPAGTEFFCRAYRCYFNPGAQPNATFAYWYRDGDDIIVCADYHRAVEHDVLVLPPECVGRAVAAVEKTPSVMLLTGDTVTDGGVAVSVNGEYGSVVLRVR